MNEYEQALDATAERLRGRPQNAAFAFIGTALNASDDDLGGRWWPRPTVTWLDGKGSSGTLGPALRCDSLAQAFVVARFVTGRGVLARWLESCTGYLVVPQECMPNPA